MSTETKRYSSHIFLHNFNLPTKQRSLLSTAIHWRRYSNVLLSAAPLVPTQRLISTWPRSRRHTMQQTLLWLSTWRWWQRRHHSSNTTHSRGNWLSDDHTYAATCWRRHPNVPYRKLNHRQRPWTALHVRRWRRNSPAGESQLTSKRSTANCSEDFHRSNWRISVFLFFQLKFSRRTHSRWPSWQFTVSGSRPKQVQASCGTRTVPSVAQQIATKRNGTVWSTITASQRRKAQEK